MERRLAEALARELGFVFDDAHVIGEGTNVLVHLRPKPVVARVTRYSHLIRSPEALAGGIAIARKLGARAVAPSSLIDAGPHVRGGRYITFWVPGWSVRFARAGRTSATGLSRSNAAISWPVARLRSAPRSATRRRFR